MFCLCHPTPAKVVFGALATLRVSCRRALWAAALLSAELLCIGNLVQAERAIADVLKE